MTKSPPSNQGESPFARVKGSDRAEDASGWPSTDAGQQPRLQIFHLLMWVTGSALILAVYRQSNMGQRGQTNASQIVWSALIVVQSMLYGGAVCSLPIYLARKLKGIPFPVHPGQWLLLISGVMHVLQFAHWGVLQLLDSTVMSDLVLPRFVWAGGYAVISVTAVCLGIVAAVAQRDSRLWMAFFLIGSARHAVAVLWYLALAMFIDRLDWFGPLNLVVSGGIGIVSAALLLCIWQDLARGVRRDWMHWAGVAVQLGSATVTACWLAAVTFLRM